MEHTDRKQGIRNRPPSHDRFEDHYDNSVKLELEYTYMPVNTQGISRHLNSAIDEFYWLSHCRWQMDFCFDY